MLGHRPRRRVETDRGFLELGFDSLTAVELRNRLTAATGPAAARDAGLRLPDAGWSWPSTCSTSSAPTATEAFGGDPAEQPVRQALAAIPLDALRRPGLLDPLLSWHRRAPAAPDGAAGHRRRRPRTWPELDVASLVRLALDGTDC